MQSLGFNVKATILGSTWVGFMLAGVSGLNCTREMTLQSAEPIFNFPLQKIQLSYIYGATHFSEHKTWLTVGKLIFQSQRHIARI